jgi:hypothetical protein
MTREVIEQDGYSSAPAFPFTNRRLPMSASPIDVARQFMKLMEPLNYDAALKHVSGTVTYMNPPPGRLCALSASTGTAWRTSGSNCP